MAIEHEMVPRVGRNETKKKKTIIKLQHVYTHTHIHTPKVNEHAEPVLFSWHN